MKIFLSILACVCLVIIILATGLWGYSSYKNIITKEKEVHKAEHKESKKKTTKESNKQTPEDTMQNNQNTVNQPVSQPQQPVTNTADTQSKTERKIDEKEEHSDETMPEIEVYDYTDDNGDGKPETINGSPAADVGQGGVPGETVH